MATLTLLNTFASGDLTSGLKISQNLDNPISGTQDSALMMNGFLDADNAAFTSISNLMVRPNTFSRGKSVGATASLDYFYQAWFNGFPGVAEQASDRVLYQAIPGAGAEFYLPVQVTALVWRWHLSWGSDSSGSATNDVPVRLFINGSVAAGTRRTTGRAVNGSTRYASQHNKFYSGHYTQLYPTAGWYNAEIRLAIQGSTQNQYCQARVWTRHMTVVAFL